MKLQREVFKVMQYHAAVDDISDITYQLNTRPGTWIPWLHGHKPRVSHGITVQQDSGAHFNTHSISCAKQQLAVHQYLRSDRYGSNLDILQHHYCLAPPYIEALLQAHPPKDEVTNRSYRTHTETTEGRSEWNYLTQFFKHLLICNGSGCFRWCRWFVPITFRILGACQKSRVWECSPVAPPSHPCSNHIFVCIIYIVRHDAHFNFSSCPPRSIPSMCFFSSQMS